MKQQWVSDDVWQQLDPHAGSLNRGQRRRAVLAASTAAAMLVAGFALDRSGLVRARIEYSAASANTGQASPNLKYFARQVAVTNTGWTTVRVTGVGHDGPGLRLLKPGDQGFPKNWEPAGATVPPFDLRPGQIATIEVAYQITDCAAVPSGSFPIALRVDRPWGTQTIDVSLPTTPAPGTPNGLVPAADMVGWQKAMAGYVCSPH